jgi:DNA polymerase-3 subunit delta
MQLRPEQLAAQLAQLDRPLAPLYLLHGDEPLLVIEAADAIRAAARKQGFEEREVIVVGTGFKWDELFMAAGNMSLFGGSKLVDLRIPSGKPGREGSEALQRYISTLGPGIVTLITLPELDWQAKKAAWVTALSNAGVAIECNAPPLSRLPHWIAERLARQQQTAPQACAGIHRRPCRRQLARRPPGNPEIGPACIRPAKFRWNRSKRPCSMSLATMSRTCARR